MFYLLVLCLIVIDSVRAITLESIPSSDDISVICLESRGDSYYITIPYYLLSCRDFTYPESPYDFLDDLVVQSPLSIEWIQHTACPAAPKSPSVSLLCCQPPSSPFFLPLSSPQISKEIHVLLFLFSFERRSGGVNPFYSLYLLKVREVWMIQGLPILFLKIRHKHATFLLFLSLFWEESFFP